MSDWQYYDFPNTIKKVGIDNNKQILSSEIKKNGHYPVIDQGKDFIAGFYDDDKKLISDNLPVIIFGDHTRCFKYIDFPFIIGADGTKVIKPDENLFIPKFYYFALLSLDIPNRGYNRHFTLLKEKKIPKPSLDEQNKISQILTLIQNAVELQKRMIENTFELKKTLANKIFTEGTYWDIKSLEKVEVSIDYGTSKKCDYDKSGTPVLRIPNIHDGCIDLTDLKYGKLDSKELNSLKLNYGDLLFVRTNGVQENAGRCSMYRGELNNCCYASYLIRVRVDQLKVLPAFINQYVQTDVGKSFLSGKAVRTADGKYNINSGILREMQIPLPSLSEQEDIINKLELIDKKIQGHNIKMYVLQSLFNSMLNGLMYRKISVNNLDIDKLKVK